jgi:3-oxoacyl-[acyl-carrier-protein] synthase-1
MTPLILTHYTLTTGLGVGLAAHSQALAEHHSGLVPCAFETASLGTWVGQIDDEALAALDAKLAHFDCRNNRLAFLALQQDGFQDAVEQARLRYGADRIGLFLGTSTSGILQTELAYRDRDGTSGALPPTFNYAGSHNNFSLAAFVRAQLELEGPAAVVSTACSSSAKVFGNAARMIAAGICDAAVVGGADSLCLTTLYGFRSLELLSREPCRPFDAQRAGISIGEGAGFALLERASADRSKRGPVLLGVGESSDAFHMSTPQPDGAGARVAMQSALASARLEPKHIHYINLHGTATRSNDAAEGKAVFDLFGPKTACSSTKGATGHLLGAAGIAEAIISALALDLELLPGSPNTTELDPSIEVRYLIKSESASIRYVMSNSFGFGGSNCSLVLGRIH